MVAGYDQDCIWAAKNDVKIYQGAGSFGQHRKQTFYEHLWRPAEEKGAVLGTEVGRNAGMPLLLPPNGKVINPMYFGVP